MKGKAVNYPFGHGMSYTSFQYSNVEVLASTDSCKKGTSTSAKAGGVVPSPLAACIRAKVTNSGGVSGAELAQLYLQFPASDNPSYSHFISTRINSGRPEGTEWDGAPPPLHPPHPLLVSLWYPDYADVRTLYADVINIPQADAGEPDVAVLKGFAKTAVLSAGASEDVHFGLTARDLSTWSTAAGDFARAPGVFTANVGASSRDLRASVTFNPSGSAAIAGTKKTGKKKGGGAVAAVILVVLVLGVAAGFGYRRFQSKQTVSYSIWADNDDSGSGDDDEAQAGL